MLGIVIMVLGTSLLFWTWTLRRERHVNSMSGGRRQMGTASDQETQTLFLPGIPFGCFMNWRFFS